MRAGERMRLEAAGYMDQTNPLYLLPNLRAKDIEIESLREEIKCLRAANNILRIANDILHRRELEKAKV